MYEKYFEKLKEELLLQNRKESTYHTYTANITKFLNWFQKEPEELTLMDARNYIYELRVEKGMSTQHCNGINSALKFFYKRVLHKQWDEEVVPRMINDTVLPRVITLEEVERMIATAKTVRNKAIIALMYSSGLRVSELCRLAPEDIYMSTMQVHVRAGKNHQDHWTILSKTALDFLIEYWKSYPVKRDHFFVSARAPHNPLKVSGVQAMIKRVGKDMELVKSHPHMLRHSFASHLVESDINLEYLQAMMGHKDPESTHRYIHVANKVLMGVKSPLDHPAPTGTPAQLKTPTALGAGATSRFSEEKHDIKRGRKKKNV